MPTAPSEDELVDAIADATREAVKELLSDHPGHSFYYCSLITTGEGHAPVLCAWSREALAEASAGDSELAEDLEWSYADSPFCCFGEAHFSRVAELFAARPNPGWRDQAASNAEHALRLRAMERALARLDGEGLFGSGPERERIVVNAEVMPPDYTNTERGMRLNPPAAIKVWLEEVAEELP